MILVIFIILLSGFAFSTFVLRKEAKADWYNDSWYYRKKLVVDHTKVSGSTNLINFPILVSRTDTDLSKAQSDGDDILFTDVNGVRLDHEIESFTQGTGVLVAWIRVPTLYAAESTVIYMYYGNPSVSNQQNTTGVWESNYMGVHHLNNVFTDSTSNSKNFIDNSTTSAAGVMANARQMDASNEYVYRTMSGYLPASIGTVELWYKETTAAAGWNTFFSSTGGNDYFNLQRAGADTSIELCFNLTCDTWTGVTNVFDGQWHHLTVTYDTAANSEYLYIDGVSQGQKTTNFSDINLTYELRVGNHTDGSLPINGIIDEFRISSTIRSVDWAATTYNTINSASTFFSTVGSEEKGTGPVAYWSFDEGYGNPNDSSGRLTTTLEGTTPPAWKSEDMCVSGKCLYFDGSTSVIEVTDPGSNSVLDYTSGDTITMEAWVRPTSFSSSPGDYTIMNKGGAGGANANYYFQYGNDGGFSLYYNQSDCAAGWDAVGTSTTPIQLNRWQHLAVTYTFGTGSSIKFYYNGQLQPTGSWATSGNVAPCTENEMLYIGDSSGTEPVKGYIDEVKIYRYARSQVQIQADFASRGASKGTAAQFGPDNKWLSDGLVGYWKMDEADWGTPNCSTDVAFDSSGNSFNADACPATTGPTGGENGKFGNGITLDNSDDYLQIADNTTIRFDSSTQDFSLFAWIKRAGTGESEIIFQKWDGASDGYKLEFRTTNTLRCGINANIFSSTNTITDTNWHHVGCVLDRDGNGQIFIDGLPDGNPQPVNSEAMATTASLRLGADNVGGSNFNGTLDEARIYNRALSPIEVNQLYNWAPGPDGYWKFDEGSGTSIADSSGNGYTGTTTGDPEWDRGKFGGSLRYDGTDDRVSMTDVLNMPASTSFTLEAWVKRTGNAAFNNPMAVVTNKNAGSAANAGYEFKIESTSNCDWAGSDGDYVCLHITDGTDTYTMVTTSGTITADSNWHHIAATIDRITENNSLIYIDGVPQAVSRTGTFSNVGALDSSSPLCVGKKGGAVSCDSGANNNYKGSIDEVKIYNYVRTTGQIIEDMNAGHPPPGSPVGSALDFWSFDEGYGDTTYDIGYGSNNGDLAGSGGSCPGAASCPTRTRDGKVNLGLSFDGINDYVDAGSPSDLDNLSTMTLTGWINPTSLGEGGAGQMFNKDGSGALGWRFVLSTGGGLRLRIDYATGDINAQSASNTITTGVWQHVAVVWDGSLTASSVKFYINGKEVAHDTSSETNGSGARSDDNTLSLVIGNNPATTATFNGILDEMKIYSSALTSDQIKAEYNLASSIVLGALHNDSSGNESYSKNLSYCIPGDTDTTCNPILEWKLDEKAGTSANDTAGSDNNGSLNGAQWVTGKTGSGLKFDGTDDYITRANDADLSFLNTQDIALTAWFKHAPKSSGIDTLMSNYNSATGTDGGFKVLMEADGDITCSIDRDNTSFPEITVSSTAATYDDNLWHQVFCYRQDATSTLFLYVDGIQVASAGSAGFEVQNTTDAFYVGIDFDGGSLSNPYQGIIDNVVIFNRTLSYPQILWNFNRGAPVAYWAFDECSGSTVYNSAPKTDTRSSELYPGTITPGASGNTSVGSCSSGVSTEMWNNGTSGKLNASLDFDGTDDFVNIGNNFEYSLPISFSAWIKLNSNSIVQNIIATDKTGHTNHTGAWLDVSTSGKADVGYADNTACGNTGYRRKTGNTTLSTGVWYHVAGVMRGATDMDVYVNGVNDNGTYDGTGGTIAYTADSGAIGKIGNCPTGDFFYDGLIDEVKIFNYSLTSQQVTNIYNDGAVRFGP